MQSSGEESTVSIIPDEMNSQHQGLRTRIEEQTDLVDEDSLKIDIDPFDHIQSSHSSGNFHFKNISVLRVKIVSF